MSVITAKGNTAKENAQKERLDLSSIYLRLKDGDSHKVRLLGLTDYVEYQSAGDFNLGIYTQPVADNSPLLKAQKEGSEKFKSLYAKPRYVFVFGSLETGELVAWDASKAQAKNLIATIEDYADEDVYKEVAFNLKRTGTGTSTSYTLNPIVRLKKEDQQAFDELEGTEVEMEFFEKIIQPKDDRFIVKLLAEIDPAVTKLFPDIDISDDEDKDAVAEVTADSDADVLDII